MLDLEALFQETLPRVRRQAQRLATPADPVWDADDLCQEGAIGLLAILARYDPTRNVRLWTYAEFRVCGAMREAKRARFDPVPRSIRRKARAIAQALQALAQQLGRAPEGNEIAQALGLSQETYEQWRTALVCLDKPWSIEYLYDTGEDTVEYAAFLLSDPAPGPAAHVERAGEQRQREEAVARAIELLPLNEQQVLRLRYWEELPLKAIGTHLGVTESRASQLHAAALARLRRWLTTDEEWPDVYAQHAQRATARQAQAMKRQEILRTQGRRAYLRLWREQQKEAHHV